ncbi:alpha beta-hydrolase [Stemphylium lycopersici]|nr:alpha beta-hydrolase [Stemphylium lycopersici]
MPSLPVPGAVLHYETFGINNKPLFVFIPGADGRGSVFHHAAALLSAHYTVVCWDRRGYSQSHLLGAQDLAHKLQTDADDAHRLIQALCPHTGAIVFGTSSGAIVAQQLLATHPQSVARLVAHEPPAFSVLPEEFRGKTTGLVEHIYATYRAQGPEQAMGVFASGLSDGPDAELMRRCMDAKRGGEIRANCLFWFEFELRQYTGAVVDMDGLRASQEKIVLVAGEESGDGPGVGPMKVVAGVLGKEIQRLPGGHLGYVNVTEKFVEGLLEVLGV